LNLAQQPIQDIAHTAHGRRCLRQKPHRVVSIQPKRSAPKVGDGRA
jgi:hypothetical protein